MPWELKIVKTIGSPPQGSPDANETLSLGNLEDIQRQLASVLPGIEFGKAPSGAEKLDLMRQQGIQIPETLASIFANIQGAHQGIYEGDGFSFEFSFGSETIVSDALLDVRGNGDPMPVLEQITRATGRGIYDLQYSKLIAPRDWETFTEWRNRSVEVIKQSTEPSSSP